LVYADETSTDSTIQTRHLTFGGKLVVIDIDFTIASDTSIISPISKITLSIAPADDDSISSLGPSAANILTSNFEKQDGERFVRNVTNLAKSDACSDPPNDGLNCFAVLRGLTDSLEIIYQRETSIANERQVMLKGWGKPVSNYEDLIGLSILYSHEMETDFSVLIGVEPRKPRFVHPPLQTIYLSSENPFVDEMDMLSLGPTSTFLSETPNWVENNLAEDVEIMPPAMCSFIMDLDPPVVVSVEAAKKICQVVGYDGWNDVTGVVKKEWISKDVMLEKLLVSCF
jgi:Mediator of RNA polymerase II transcription subunit 1